MRNVSKKSNAQSGIALYLAIFIGTMLMATSLGISTIFYRELRISRLLFPSLLAFYAADTGVECALYHDLQQDVFDETAPPGTFTITCNGSTRTVTHTKPMVDIDHFTFNFDLSGGNTCVASVRVKKQLLDIPLVGPTLCTRIDSFGRDASCGTPGSASVDRGVVSIYSESCYGFIDGS